MRHASVLLAVAATVLALAPIVRAADGTQPEIKREIATAQPVGQLHTLRNIPEACVRLQGQFTGDATKPYTFEAAPRERCAQRAAYVDASTLKKAPTAKSGWILNDRISVPRTDAPNCVAVLEVWRHEGNTAPPALDPQGRSRLYLDKPQATGATPPLFTAMLAIQAKACD